MNLRSDLALMLSGYTAVPPCLLFRHADGMRLDGCITLLVQEGQNLALSCTADAALDHYADLLLHRLRRATPCPVDVYFPASTSALVSRFEELVADMTLEQAMAQVAGAPPQRIWLVHEAGALALAELQLLSRLVGNFPGAGVRVVLLFGSSAAARKGFESPGRRFARWDIQPPSPEEAAAMLTQARQQGGESVVSTVLARLGLAPAPLPSAPPHSIEARLTASSALAADVGLHATAAPRVDPRPAPGGHRSWSLPDVRLWAAGLPKLVTRAATRATGTQPQRQAQIQPQGQEQGQEQGQVQDVVDKRGESRLRRLRLWAAGLWRSGAVAAQSLPGLKRRPAPTRQTEAPPASTREPRP
jgi:hypothetical protein